MAASTSASTELKGSCNCGRNTYVIEVPLEGSVPAVKDVVRVVWDGSQPPYLRIPLPWYHSTTYAFFPDETHTAIHRIYHLEVPSGQRHFCGYCGARVSHWLEGEREKDWMYVDLGTLGGESLVSLEGMGVVGEDMESGGAEAQGSDNGVAARAQGGDGLEEDGQVQVQRTEDENGWFERIVGRSGGGRVKVSRGTTSEGGARVQWEVLEWTGDEGGDGSQEAALPGKRKLEHVQMEDGTMEE